MKENTLFKSITHQMHMRSGTGVILLLLAISLFVTACSGGQESTTTPVPTGDAAIQIPEEAQLYIDEIKDLLVEDLGIGQEQIVLESITEPAALDEPYIIKVAVEEITYEYQALDGEIILIFISEPDPMIIED